MPRGAAEVGAADALPGRGEFKHHVDAGLAGVGVIRFARDPPLEGDGFEPSVPREGAGSARRLSAYLEGSEKNA
jgi:hypothetical protein